MRSERSRLFSTLLHAGFALTGVVTTLLGPILPALMQRWGLHDREAGRLLATQFLGSTCGVALSSALVPRLGFRRSLVFGFAVISVGVGGLGVGSHGAGLASIFLYGIGLGLVIPATNLAVAEANPMRSAAALNVLNMVWGIGAVAWPFCASRMLGSAGTTGLIALAAVLSLTALGLALAPVRIDPAPALALRPSAPAGPLGLQRLVIFGLLFFLYVGTENAVAGWAALHAQRLTSGDAAGFVLMPALFWGALLVGRGLAPWLLRRFDDAGVALAGLVLAAMGATILLEADGLRAVAGALVLAGLGLASVFPIVIALMSRTFGAAARRVAGFMFALANLGGASLPWLVGVLSTRFGGLRTGLAAPLLACLVMVALVALVRRRVMSGAVTVS